MIIIGELINASRRAIGVAIETGDAGTIQKEAIDQTEAGADFIDVNAGIFVGKEPEYLKWLVQTVQGVTELPCAIDSPDPRAVEAALSVHQGIPLINSISLEKERYDSLMPIVAGTDMKVVALCMSDKGMPQTANDRLKIAEKMVNALVQNNVSSENIFVDPLVQPLSVNDLFGLEFLNAIELIMKRFQGVHTVCGLSNILPARKFMNQAFMAIAIAKGLDSAIINPLDKKMMANIIAAEALVGKNKFCTNYIATYRTQMFDAERVI